MTQGSSEGRGSRVTGRGYQQLRAWQKAHALALGLFRTAKPLSTTQNWLYRQCTRSAVSVAANIAEGYSRGSLREYIHFLNIARGSLAETEYYLLFMRDADLLPSGAVDKLDPLTIETGKLLLGLIRSLQAKDASGVREVRRIREKQVEYVVPSLDDGAVLDP